MAGSSSEDESSRKRGAVLNSSAALLFVCGIRTMSEMRSPGRWLLHNEALCRSGHLGSNPPANLLRLCFEIFFVDRDLLLISLSDLDDQLLTPSITVADYL